MQVFMRGLGAGPRLADWEDRGFARSVQEGPGPADHQDCYERIVGQERPGDPEADGPHLCAAAAIWRYDIFPPERVRAVLRRASVSLGDTVGICFHAPLGLDLFFAARVSDRFDGLAAGAKAWRSGFTYRTLAGHPELGEETFSVEKDRGTGAVRVALRSWSRPGTWLARLGTPVVRRLQVQASQAALEHLARVAAGPR